MKQKKQKIYETKKIIIVRYLPVIMVCHRRKQQIRKIMQSQLGELSLLCFSFVQGFIYMAAVCVRPPVQIILWLYGCNHKSKHLDPQYLSWGAYPSLDACKYVDVLLPAYIDLYRRVYPNTVILGAEIYIHGLLWPCE